jgi:hypothetical protein
VGAPFVKTKTLYVPVALQFVSGNSTILLCVSAPCKSGALLLCVAASITSSAARDDGDRFVFRSERLRVDRGNGATLQGLQYPIDKGQNFTMSLVSHQQWRDTVPGDCFDDEAHSALFATRTGTTWTVGSRINWTSASRPLLVTAVMKSNMERVAFCDTHADDDYVSGQCHPAATDGCCTDRWAEP